MNRVKTLIFVPTGLLLAGLAFVQINGCAKTTAAASEDSSASGAVASAAGGAMSGSSSSGTLSRSTTRKTSCPTVTTPGTGCTVVTASSVIALNYSACSFGSSAATWTGTQQVAASGIACGTFPQATISRQFVSGAAAGVPGVPATGSRTSAAGNVVTIDHASANLLNYQSDTISHTVGNGYGNVVTWSSGVRTQVALAERVYSTSFDHSVYSSSPLAITETAGATSRTITSGTVTVYHNLLKVKGSSSFSNVVFNDGCCTPVSGSITTTFAATSASGVIGNAVNGKSETLTFTGCGTGTLTAYDGLTASVTLANCL